MKRAGGPEAVVTYARRASLPAARAAVRPRACGSPPVGTASREGWFFAGPDDPYALTDDDDSDGDGSSSRHSARGLCVACGTIPACVDEEKSEGSGKRTSVPAARRKSRCRVEHHVEQEQEQEQDVDVPCGDDSAEGECVPEHSPQDAKESPSPSPPPPPRQRPRPPRRRRSAPQPALRHRDESAEEEMPVLEEDSLSLLGCAEQRARGELLDDLRYTLDGVAHGGAVAARSAARLLEHAAADARGVGLLFRAEGLFAPLDRALAACDARTGLALLGTLLCLLAADDINAAAVTCAALAALARAIATLRTPAPAPAARPVLPRAESDSTALRTAAATAAPCGSPALKSRARSAFFSCVRQQQQQRVSSPPSLVRSVSECGDVDVAEAARDVIAGTAPFAGLRRDAVCCPFFTEEMRVVTRVLVADLVRDCRARVRVAVLPQQEHPERPRRLPDERRARGRHRRP